ncbi:hypothetical protein [Thiocystis violacea]|uniref:hypothetical protein n=1 Tax=Thiocystis violacea TaxID=13725 RepID=UPI00190746C4|nr:hypothetical protein [Thiocystis violacea]MBK1717361.1 hypothetical protein [Thiocystis violacea]
MPFKDGTGPSQQGQGRGQGRGQGGRRGRGAVRTDAGQSAGRGCRPGGRGQGVKTHQWTPWLQQQIADLSAALQRLTDRLDSVK